jgi:leucyl-tRNA synthetase
MGVPAHDERDHEFAEKYGLPIPKVIDSENPWEEGVLVNSGQFTGLTSEAAVDAMVAKLGGRAEKAITFKLKDWGLSRQRYWGTPIPTIHCPKCGVVPEKVENLPVRLPEDVAFSGAGASPLLTSPTFLDAPCPKCGGPGRRETDTMDTFVDSSWYWMRYLDPKNTEAPFAKAEADAWSPVDLYIGGIEHATMHLIYARYFYKIMRDLGLASGDEPFKKLICQGMVLKDGFKMSKSKGNIVDPDEVIARYGTDALRLFMIFAAPIEKEIDWTGFEGIDGATRFLRRVTRMVEDHTPCQDPIPAKDQLTAEEKTLLVKIHQTLHKVTDDLSHRYQFNTLVSSLMELANALGDLPADAPHRGAILQRSLEIFTLMLSPAAPHLAEQLWETLGGKGFCMHAAWPEADPAWLLADEVTVVVQVNGKVRGRILVAASASEDERRAAALACPEALHHLEGKEIVKVVVPPGGKLVSIVVK